MNKFSFILGGARSGKSSYAVEQAKGLSRNVLYIATCSNPDEEMWQRIKLHQCSRPSYWKLVEEGRNVSDVINQVRRTSEVIIVDCLGVLVTNLLLSEMTDADIVQKLVSLAEDISQCNVSVIVVSNEVGSGIVPEHALARRFRDVLGLGNQIFAKKADEVIFMQAGIPVRLKG